jgi:sulfopyruvate decarboxylase subunit alpha
MAAAASADSAARALHGDGIIAAIKASGIEYVLAVPDITTSSGLLAPIANDPAFRLIRVCKEDECIGIASGLSYADKRALILIQHTGFLDSINAIRGIAVEYKQPICMMVGLLQHDPDKTPRESPRYGVRIIEPICDDMGIAHHLISLDADIGKIQPAIEQAYRTSEPVALLIGRRPKSADGQGSDDEEG